MFYLVFFLFIFQDIIAMCHEGSIYIYIYVWNYIYVKWNILIKELKESCAPLILPIVLICQWYSFRGEIHKKNNKTMEVWVGNKQSGKEFWNILSAVNIIEDTCIDLCHFYFISLKWTVSSILLIIFNLYQNQDCFILLSFLIF